MASLISRSFGLALIMIAVLGQTLRCGGQTALVRHAPTLNGGVEGSVQQMLPENVTLNGNAFVSDGLLVPGSPTVRLNGNAQYGGAVAGGGSASPKNFQVTLNGRSRLGQLRTRTDPVTLPTVVAPPQPAGTRSVSLNNAGQSPGDFSTIRNLTLNGNVGPVAVPPGTYGNFISNGNSRLILGVAGANQPVVYHFQNLTLNGNSALEVVGPVSITLNGGSSTNSPMGSSLHPEWLTLRIAGGGLSLNSNGSFFGQLVAPDGTLTLNSNVRFIGGVVCDRLIVNGNGLLQLVAATPVNQLPTIVMSAPSNGTSVALSAAITLVATAADPDGSVAKVEFSDNATMLGLGTLSGSSTYQLRLPGGLPLGSHILSAKVTDNQGATAVSAPVSIVVSVPANRPPITAITTPAAGATLVSREPWNLSATAVDADGAIVRVELLVDDELAGTLVPSTERLSEFSYSAPVLATPGKHKIKVRAYDDAGSTADSASREVTVIASLPYRAGFESAEDYRPGALDGQLGWVVTQGSAEVSGVTAFDGLRSLEMKSGLRGAFVSQAFALPDAPTISFVDLFVRPSAAANPTEGTVIEMGGAGIAFVRAGSDGQLQARDAALGAEAWPAAGAAIPLDPQGVATRWVRLTARLNYQTMTWDLYLDGQLALFDLALSYTDPPPRGLPAISFLGLASVPSFLDFLLVGPENSLFADADHDGMDDAWEIANGLDPAVDDRDGDRDGDGLANLREYFLGTRADSDDTDGDGLPDGWEVRHHLNPLVATPFDADSDRDGLSDRQEYAAGTDPTMADTDGDGLPDSWEIAHGLSPFVNDAAADPDGDGLSNLQEYLAGSDPRDFFNGAAPRTEALNGGGPGPANELSMLVLKPDGTRWANAPAVFQVTSGTRRISASPNGPNYGLTAAVRADANGVARAYLESYEP